MTRTAPSSLRSLPAEGAAATDLLDTLQRGLAELDAQEDRFTRFLAQRGECPLVARELIAVDRTIEQRNAHTNL